MTDKNHTELKNYTQLKYTDLTGTEWSMRRYERENGELMFFNLSDGLSIWFDDFKVVGPTLFMEMNFITVATQVLTDELTAEIDAFFE